MIGIVSSGMEQNNDTRQNTLYESYIARIAGGDKDALASLYTCVKSAVFGFALSFTRSSSEAEDILQDTFVNVFTSAGQYKPMGKPMAWVLTICRNLCLMKIRDKSKSVNVPDDEWDIWVRETATLTGKAGSLFSAQSETDDRILLSAAIKKISADESQIIMLHAVAGFKHREVAKMLKCPLSTVLSKYNRAIKKLKSLLQEGVTDGKHD